MKKQLSKLLNVALLLSLIILSSCQKDLYDEAIKEEFRIKVDKFSLKDLIESNEKKLNVSTIEAKLLNAVEKVKSKNEENRIQYNSEKGYYFDDENGLVVTKEDYHSYIFKIYREQHNDVSKLENIVFSLNENGEFDSYIIKYDATEEQIRDNESLVFDILSVDELDVENTEAGRIIVIEFLNSLCHTPPNCYGSICGFELVSFMMIEPHESTTGNINNFPDNNGGGINPNMVMIPNSGYSPLTRQFVNKLISNLSIDYFYALSTETQASILAYVDSLPTNAANDKVVAFLNQQNTFWLSDQTLATQTSVINYLIQNNFFTESGDFANELIDFCLDEENSTESLNAFNTTLDLINSNNFLNIGTEASNAIISSNLNEHWPTIGTYGFMMTYNALVLQEMQLIMSTYPDGHVFTTKEYALIYLKAQTEAMHLALDILGMTPVIGPVFDVTNGVWYTFNGDFVNAGMSYLAVVPFVGDWTTVARITKRVYTVGGTTKVILKAYRKLDGTIVFSNRGQLRKMLGLTNLAYHAHHIIPYSLTVHPLVQKAAKFSSDVKKAWHPNDIANGIPILADFHLNGHAAYTAKIENYLNNLNNLNPNMSIEAAHDALTEYMQLVKNTIIANPNLSLGEIAILIP